MKSEYHLYRYKNKVGTAYFKCTCSHGITFDRGVAIAHMQTSHPGEWDGSIFIVPRPLLPTVRRELNLLLEMTRGED
jgi:hypothetical protein